MLQVFTKIVGRVSLFDEPVIIANYTNVLNKISIIKYHNSNIIKQLLSYPKTHF
jgi:hypothetical protein